MGPFNGFSPKSRTSHPRLKLDFLPYVSTVQPFILLKVRSLHTVATRARFNSGAPVASANLISDNTIFSLYITEWMWASSCEKFCGIWRHYRASVSIGSNSSSPPVSSGHLWCKSKLCSATAAAAKEVPRHPFCNNKRKSYQLFLSPLKGHSKVWVTPYLY